MTKDRHGCFAEIMWLANQPVAASPRLEQHGFAGIVDPAGLVAVKRRYSSRNPY